MIVEARRGIVGAVLGPAVAVALLAQGGLAKAQEYYKGKQVSLSVGYAAGGGYDVYARIVGRHYGEHLPGRPSIVVKNMPGAGSLRVTNYLYQGAPKDGTEIAAVGREIPTAALLDAGNVRFKSSEFNWLGNLSSERSFCISLRSGPIASSRDMFEKEFVVGGTTGGSATIVYPVMMNNLLGTKMKVISGYEGSADIYLAMERGEIDGRCNASLSSLQTARPKWLEDKSVVILVETSTSDKPLVPGVPLINEFAKSENARQAIELLLAPDQWNRPYVAPPGVPAERVKLLRDGFDGMARSAAFVEDMKRQRLELDPMTGDEMTRRILAMERMSTEVIQTAIAAIKPK